MAGFYHFGLSPGYRWKGLILFDFTALSRTYTCRSNESTVNNYYTFITYLLNGNGYLTHLYIKTYLFREGLGLGSNTVLNYFRVNKQSAFSLAFGEQLKRWFLLTQM